jgi:hypothetical protein
MTKLELPSIYSNFIWRAETITSIKCCVNSWYCFQRNKMIANVVFLRANIVLFQRGGEREGGAASAEGQHRVFSSHPHATAR